MWIPFRDWFDKSFRSRRGVAYKVGVGAVFGVWVGIYISIQSAVEDNNSLRPPLGYVGLIAICTVVTVSVVAGLLKKDSEKKRMEMGQTVNLLSRLMLHSGALSVIVWFLLTFAIAVTLAVHWP